MRDQITVEQAIHILENKTGYHIVAEDCDADTVSEAILIVCKALKEQMIQSYC